MHIIGYDINFGAQDIFCIQPSIPVSTTLFDLELFACDFIKIILHCISHIMIMNKTQGLKINTTFL